MPKREKNGFAVPILLLAAFFVISGVLFFWIKGRIIQTNNKNPTLDTLLPQNGDSEIATSKEDIPQVSVFAEGLEVPWAIAFLPTRSASSTADAGGPDSGMLVTEREGRVRLITKDGQLQQEPVAIISSVKQVGEGGLHGIALHPDFSSNSFVYLYYTYSDSGGNTLNRVVRMLYQNNKLTDEKIIVDQIAGASNHDGGRVKFGPDKLLYITTGDAQNPSSAQDKNALSGKILRVTDDGSPAPGNPFGNRIFSYGHRNPQGITWDKDGGLWSTEHGPSGFETGNDEFNRIEIGKNYGWPEIRGTQTKSGMETPILESGRSDTWAPAGLAYLPAQAGINGRFFFAGLRGQALYEVTVTGSSANLKTHFKGEYGRLREVMLGPDKMLYVTTSNRDGRGLPKSGDDKILRINPEKL